MQVCRVCVRVRALARDSLSLAFAQVKLTMFAAALCAVCRHVALPARIPRGGRGHRRRWQATSGVACAGGGHEEDTQRRTRESKFVSRVGGRVRTELSVSVYVCTYLIDVAGLYGRAQGAGAQTVHSLTVCVHSQSVCSLSK